MCLRLFLAADWELPLVPWNAERPAFNVTPLSTGEEPVRQQFTRKWVYCAGAHTHCSCGFSPVEEPDETDRLRSLDALSGYLADASGMGPLEMYVCWDGDWETTPLRHLRMAPPELGSSDEWIAEGSFTLIQRAAA